MLVASERNLTKGTRYEVTKRYVWTVERHVGGEVFAFWREARVHVHNRSASVACGSMDRAAPIYVTGDDFAHVVQILTLRMLSEIGEHGDYVPALLASSDALERARSARDVDDGGQGAHGPGDGRGGVPMNRAQNLTLIHTVTRDGELVELEVHAQIAGSLDILAIVDTETGAPWTGTLTDREESKLRDRLFVAASEADDGARDAARERMVRR